MLYKPGNPNLVSNRHCGVEKRRISDPHLVLLSDLQLFSAGIVSRAMSSTIPVVATV